MADELTPILQQIQRYQAALINRDEEAVDRLITTYRLIYDRLQDKIDLLMLEIGNAENGITRSQLMQMQRYQALMAQIKEELDRFQNATITEIERLGDLGVDAGIANSQALINETAKLAGISVDFNALPKEVIISLLGFLDPQGPLYARLKMLSGATAEAVSQAILEGVGLGYNPIKIARGITKNLGMGLTDALRNVRTIQLWSYRETSRATFMANSDILAGWIWFAELSEKTCLSCLALHGTIHPLDEPLNDHYCGRCTPMPFLKGQKNPVTESGEAWFTKLSETKQQEMMGNAKWSAWKEGKFKFSDLTGIYQSEVYGSMRVEKSLKELSSVQSVNAET